MDAQKQNFLQELKLAGLNSGELETRPSICSVLLAGSTDQVTSEWQKYFQEIWAHWFPFQRRWDVTSRKKRSQSKQSEWLQHRGVWSFSFWWLFYQSCKHIKHTWSEINFETANDCKLKTAPIYETGSERWINGGGGCMGRRVCLFGGSMYPVHRQGAAAPPPQRQTPPPQRQTPHCNKQHYNTTQDIVNHTFHNISHLDQWPYTMSQDTEGGPQLFYRVLYTVY